jgi:hypothetical protein
MTELLRDMEELCSQITGLNCFGTFDGWPKTTGVLAFACSV